MTILILFRTLSSSTSSPISQLETPSSQAFCQEGGGISGLSSHTTSPSPMTCQRMLSSTPLIFIHPNKLCFLLEQTLAISQFGN
ncbi:hypothetical protein CMV_020543 [Castanea mollissima]|uniref:Uncharacterized protein n=1 Tax=Castanea mollissima TaxID=60419 RepID=A0A8J4VMK8_9ROSI|nr:hypothetical protein CMV_020543 [Castanea mollissima]